MSFENIQKALNGELKSFGVANSIDAALPNEGYEPDLSKPYLEGSHRPTSKDTADLGVSDITKGFYQININYASGRGSTLINRMADLINAVFKPGACFAHNATCVNIVRCEPGPIIPNDGWATMPITIYWDSYSAQL